MEASLSVSLYMYVFFWFSIYVGFPSGSVKNLPAVQETQVRSLGQEDPLEEVMATHSSILAWRIPWTEELGGLQSMELQSQTRLKHLSTVHIYAYIWRREWLPTPVFLPREFCGPRTVVNCISPWGPKESDTIEQLILSFSFPD